MNTSEKSGTPWRRFVQIGLVLVLGALVTSGIVVLHVLQTESAKVLAGGFLWIAILLWGILFVQMMALVNTTYRAT